MKLIVVRTIDRPGTITLACVRNNHRLKYGEAFVEDGLLDRVLRRHGDALAKVGDALDLAPHRDVSRLHRALDRVAPSLDVDANAMEAVIANLVGQIERTIAVHGDRLRAQGIDVYKLDLMIRREIARRLANPRPAPAGRPHLETRR